jgi:hypothetical protein
LRIAMNGEAGSLVGDRRVLTPGAVRQALACRRIKNFELSASKNFDLQIRRS